MDENRLLVGDHLCPTKYAWMKSWIPFAEPILKPYEGSLKTGEASAGSWISLPRK